MIRVRAVRQTGVAQLSVVPSRPAVPVQPVRGSGWDHRLARLVDGAPLQRRVAMTDASDFQTWGGNEIGKNAPELTGLVEELEEDFDWNKSEIIEFKKFVDAPALYTFDDFDHLNEYIGDQSTKPPAVEEDMGAAEAMDDIAKEFGSSFKGKHIAYSGSRVYAVGRPGPLDTLWATQNSATGLLAKKTQTVVKNWTLPSPLQTLLDNVVFPSNTKRSIEQSGMDRPDVMTANAHAEVNQYVRLAILGASHGVSVHDIGLQLASDIAHCAECFWALHALAAKGAGKFYSYTGCENKLFARWREPWSGFYASYGPNPFRKPDGSFRQNSLTKKDFAAGSYTALELNAASTFKIYS